MLSHQIFFLLTQHITQFFPSDFQVDHISHAQFGHSSHDVFREEFFVEIVFEFRPQIFVSLKLGLSLQFLLVSFRFIFTAGKEGGRREYTS